MPSRKHEIFVGIEGDCQSGGEDLSQATPVEYRADAVTVVRDDGGALRGAIVVEIQVGVDADKRWTWPLYVAALRARMRCPAMLLVVALESAIARWAAKPIALGHPGFELVPIVVSYANLPRVTDLAFARRAPELAVLSALAHPELETAEVAAAAIHGLPPKDAGIYLDLVLKALPDAARIIMEAHMIENYEYQSDFARRYIAQGRDEGREEGREEGLRAAAIQLARAKLGTLSADEEARLAAMTDADGALTGLIIALGRAANADEARVALERTA